MESLFRWCTKLLRTCLVRTLRNAEVLGEKSLTCAQYFGTAPHGFLCCNSEEKGQGNNKGHLFHLAKHRRPLSVQEVIKDNLNY